MNRKLLTVAIAGALAAPMAAQAVNFKISGHINRMVRYADDGAASDIQSLDNGASRSRMRVKGSADLGNGMKAGLYSEFALVRQRGSSSAIKTNGTGGPIDIRHSAVWFSGNWGKLTLGHTSTAADCADCAAFNTTWMANEATSPTDWLFGVGLREDNNNNPVAGKNIGSAWSTIDGTRDAEIRYDTPAFGPAAVAVDIGNNQKWAAGLKASGAAGGGKYAFRFGYDARDNASGFSQYIGSAAYQFSQGTSIQGGYAVRDFVTAGRSNAKQWWVMLAHNWGNNGVSVSYAQSNDLLADGADSDSIGVGYNRAFPKAGVDVYAGFQHITFDVNAAAGAGLGLTGTNGIQDVNAAIVGSRVKFN